MNRSTLFEAIETAYEWAQATLDLSQCYYGEPHWKGPFVSSPYPYYFFLAGLAAQLRCRRILEMGTHFGGSIFSIARGLEHSGILQTAEIVTIDTNDSNRAAFRTSQPVKRILGNCLDRRVARQAASEFTGSVDLMFVDTTHTYEHTQSCLETYIPLVLPRLVIVDDIRLNDSMSELWKDLVSNYGNCAIDITDHSRRGKEVGFGLLICGFAD